MVIARNTGFAAAFLATLLISSSSSLVNAQNYPSVAYPPNSWINVPEFDLSFWDSAGIRPILITGTFVCCFHCHAFFRDNCLFAISNFPNTTFEGNSVSSPSPKIVWSANRSNPVKIKAALQLSENGDLMLQDLDGTVVWNTNTAGKFVSGLNLTEEGNLVLYGRNNEKVKIYEPEQHKVLYVNGRFGPFVFPHASSSQFIQLGSGGRLSAYQLRESNWEQVSDLLVNYTGPCGFPLVCGEYGICSDGHCSCPKAEGNETVVYFSQVSENDSCSENIPVSCKRSDYPRHGLLELEGFDYFNFIPHIENVNRTKCKEACLMNCSCKAAIYRQPINSSVGYCFLLSKVFSFKRNADSPLNYTSFSYIKVQNPPTDLTISGADRPSKGHIKTILGSTLGPILVVLFVIVALSFSRRNKTDSNHPILRFTRFSYDYLGAMTQNFSVKLGEGGFGAVLYGSLPNSAKIAVKRLDGTGHVMKSFVAEVETLASVHHINLVTLIGFCAEKSHRLLVYEYLHNGSLDRWIFSKNPQCTLGWELRKKIINDVANGLAYLHHGCDQKILHLNIKPQNILLDENFNARLADFGLSKLIDRGQNHVLTTMRGTPGYMAPEWSSATITEKVDVYSFGIVVWEILCGRRNVDRSQPEEEMHLLRLFTKKAEDGKLLELVDKFSEDMQSNGTEVVKMMRIAAWCLQADYTRRPSMSTVLSVLRGYLNIEDNLSYEFLNLQAPRAIATPSDRGATTTIALPSMLSGPR
ncbi:hypothetical protein DITRI_Ditri16bG0098000 [Diplodiscus trichospermus]